jgi:hypothetical protein
MKKAYLGIDPGVNGALCVTWDDGVIDAYRCPRGVDKMSALVRSVTTHCSVENYKLIAGIERVWTLPRDGRKGAFTFGMNYGMWLGILSSNNIQPKLILPKEWQSMLKRYKIPKDYQDKKRKLKSIAQKYVKFKVTLVTADAILISKYLKEYTNE